MCLEPHVLSGIWTNGTDTKLIYRTSMVNLKLKKKLYYRNPQIVLYILEQKS